MYSVLKINQKERDLMKRYLSVKEVAEYLGVSRMTIYNMVKDKQLPQGRRFRGVRRWDFEELKDFLKEGKE